jgi:hypothetical protein
VGHLVLVYLSLHGQHIGSVWLQGNDNRVAIQQLQPALTKLSSFNLSRLHLSLQLQSAY